MKAGTKKKIGGTYCFTYPNYGTPDTHMDYTAHSGQNVTVLEQLKDTECDPEAQPMYVVKAADGWTGCAHGSELRKVGVAQRRKHCFASAQDLKECAAESVGEERYQFVSASRLFLREARLA
jgi:hypothetical protein